MLKLLRTYWWPVLLLILVAAAIFTRFYHVTQVPPSLYDEEIALGYDAYSVLKTGHDHFGNLPTLVAFESYGDYKPALYFYMLVPSIAIFGLNEFAVRLPTMLAGVSLVFAVGILARLLWNMTQAQRPAAQTAAAKITGRLVQATAMCVTIVSPWAILFSRSAWESMVATAAMVWGSILMLLAWERVPKAPRVAAGCTLAGLLTFSLAMYTYHAARFTAPLLAFILFLAICWREVGGWESLVIKFRKPMHLRKVFLKYLLLGICFLGVTAPLVLSLRGNAVQQRLDETSIFADGHVVRNSNAMKAAVGNVWWSKLLFHRDVFYVSEFLSNYLQHFSWAFLFVNGDHALRHSVQYFGQLYIFEGLFIFAGMVWLWKRQRTVLLFLVSWLLIGNVPAGLTDAAPHALRTLAVLPVYLVLITYGIAQVVVTGKNALQKIAGKKAVWLVATPIALLYIAAFTSFWHFYQDVYPKLYSGAWAYGYRQIVAEVNRRKDGYANVSITREMDRPAMAYWFFSASDPRDVQKLDHQLQYDAGPELQFQNIHFVNFAKDAPPGLIASTVESLQRLQASGVLVSNITEINDPTGKPIWAVYEKK